ncbi:MAG: SPOR domain-containing protein [Gammaproteobacteria bacterium]
MFDFITGRTSSAKFLIAGILFILCYLPGSNLFAQSPTSDIFEGLFISNTSQGQSIRIKLSLPVTKVSHFPVSHGRYVSIKLKPVIPGALDDYPLSRIAILSPTLDTDTPLIDINYEKDDFGNLVLEAKFKTNLNFQVEQPTNEVITIFLPREGTSRKPEPDKQATKKYYAINLQSTTEQRRVKELEKIKSLQKYKSYTTKAVISGKTWYRLRIGFFTDKNKAFQLKQTIKKLFPAAWVTRVTGDEIALAEEWFIEQEQGKDKIALDTAPPLPEPRVVYPERASVIPKTGSRAEKLMEIARQAMADGQYKKAIRYYAKILELNNAATNQDALEFLGVAREKNNQLAHAKAEYEKYLSLYPDSEGAIRVKQRLTAILTARKVAKQKLAKKKTSDDTEWQYHGSFSQFYRRQDISTDFSPDLNVDDSLNTDFALTGRYRGQSYDMRSQITANHRYDFNDETDPNESKVYSLYLDVTHKNSNISGRVGRQTHNGDGVLGRFDGMLLRYQINNNWKVKAIGGYPVELTRSNISDKNKQFFGLSVDAESLIENWKFTFYGINQTAYDINDREAVGVESQYRDEKTSLYTTFDYDTSYKKLNNITLVGTRRFENQAAINLLMDYRNSPFLTTSNALIGQTSSNLEELLMSFTEEQIRELALDRTARFKSITLSGSIPINSKYQINGDITASSLSSTPTSGGVIGSPSTGTEYYTSVQLIANNFFSDNDTTVFGLRYGDASTSESSAFTLSTRLSPSPEWRIYPRLTIDKRKSDSGIEKTTYKPLVKFDYRYKRNVKFRMELGYDDATIQTDLTEEKEQTRYIYAGYIYDF